MNKNTMSSKHIFSPFCNSYLRQKEMANYPQHVNDLKHLILQKTIYPHEVKHFPVSFKKSED